MKKVIPLFLLAFLMANFSFSQTVKLEDVVNATPGTVYVDIDMLGFTGTNGNVGAITLEIQFDNNLLTYTGESLTSILGGTLMVGVSGNEMNIVWLTNNPSSGININGTFYTLEFNYTGGFYTELVFLSNNEIANFYGQVIPSTFQNGSITPITNVDGYLFINGVTNAVQGDPVQLPVFIQGDPLSTKFEEVTSMTLYISYDPTKLQFLQLTNNVYGFTAGNNNGLLTLVWASTTPVDFKPLTQLFDLNFTYLGGGTANVDFAPGTIVTRYTEILIIMTTGATVVPNPNLPQKAIIGNVTYCEEDYVLVPVDFAGMPTVGSFNLVIGFDPGVITYNGLVNINPLISNLSVGLSGGNTITVAWASIAGQNLNGKLFDIMFETVFDPNTSYPPPMPNFSCNVIFKGGSIVKKPDGSTIPTSYFNGSVTHARTLSLKLLLEGFYNGSGTMNKVKDFDGVNFVDKYAGNIVDLFTVELRAQANYSTLIWSNNSVQVLTNGNATVYVPYVLNGTYWITIKHRNHIETVSSSAVSFAGCSASWDFTNAVSKAYGNNLKPAGGGFFVIFAGDVNQDGNITVLDRALIDLDIYNGVQGYVVSDINGNGSTTIVDRAITDVNIYDGVAKVTP